MPATIGKEVIGSAIVRIRINSVEFVFREPVAVVLPSGGLYPSRD